MTTVEPAAIPMPNRREFLYYLAGGALLLTAGVGVALARHFLQEIPREGIDFLNVDLLSIPPIDAYPNYIFDAQSYFVQTENGLLVLVAACSFESSYSQVRIQPKWDEVEYKFKCPLCGSHFALDGSYLAGPSRRNMDQYVVMVQTARGRVETPPDGAPVSLEGVTALTVDLRRVIYGAARGSVGVEG